jgi:hypothetical protein
VSERFCLRSDRPFRAVPGTQPAQVVNIVTYNKIYTKADCSCAIAVMLSKNSSELEN